LPIPLPKSFHENTWILTQYLDVDFIDNLVEDLISTDRQSLNWDKEKASGLRVFLAGLLGKVEVKWRIERKTKRRLRIKEITSVDVAAWLENVPDKIRERLDRILILVDSSELSASEQSTAVNNLNTLVPEYPNLHWRYLHEEIKDAAENDYKNKDYYRAFIEAVKRYINRVREKSGSSGGSDQSMMGAVFGLGKVLQVAASYKKPNGASFDADTYKCIEEGQKLLSMGIVSGARNPISHEEIEDLRESNLFSEKDCLDMLSLLSHLFKRLEDAPSVP